MRWVILSNTPMLQLKVAASIADSCEEMWWRPAVEFVASFCYDAWHLDREGKLSECTLMHLIAQAMLDEDRSSPPEELSEIAVRMAICAKRKLPDAETRSTFFATIRLTDESSGESHVFGMDVRIFDIVVETCRRVIITVVPLVAELMPSLAMRDDGFDAMANAI